jgi:hypothetical protein
MKYIRILPLAIPFLIFLLFELFFFYPKNIYVALVISGLLVFFAVSRFAKEAQARERLWNFLILPVFFLTGLGFYSALISSHLFVQILFIFNSVFLYFYLRSIYYYLIKPLGQGDLPLENIYSYGSFLVFFFISSLIYGLQSFLNIPIWPMMIALVFIAGLVVYGVMRANEIKTKEVLIFILISSLVLVELAWSISFLPLNFNIAGLILALCYYMFTGLAKHHFLEKLDKKIARLYLLSGFGSITILLLTARWM